MNWLNDIIGVINNYLWSYVLIVMLIGIGLWFTVRTRFVQIRCIPEMFRLMTEGAGAKPREGHISTFQAFCVSTASRVGVGNIAGIAIAVATGGPGAVFWMWVIATIGAASGFVESTLAQIYKAPRKGGGFVGGPAYYIGNVIGSSFFASVFAVLLAVTYGLIFNSVQANTISLSMQTSFGFDTQMTGLAIAGFTALVIFGGLTRIAKVVGVMVPVMAGAYILVALAVTALNITMVPEVLVTIVRCAFDFDAVLGAGFGMALMTGISAASSRTRPAWVRSPMPPPRPMPPTPPSRASCRRSASTSTRSSCARPPPCSCCSPRAGPTPARPASSSSSRRSRASSAPGRTPS